MVGDADGGGVGGTGKARRWAKVSLPLLLLALISSVAGSAFAFSHVRPRRCSTARFCDAIAVTWSVEAPSVGAPCR